MFDLFNLEYHILAEVFACLFSFILLANMIVNYIPHERRCRLFLNGAICSVINTFFNCAAVYCITYFQHIPGCVSTLISTVFFITLLGIPLVLCDYAIDISMPYSNKKYFLSGINGTVYTIFLIIVFLNLKTGWIFKYDSELGYVKGSLKYLTYILTSFYAIETLCVIIANKKSMPNRLFAIFLLYPVISFFLLVFQLLLKNVLLSGSASLSALLIAYISLQSDKKEFDPVSNLMTNHVFTKHLEKFKKNAVLFYVIIDNYENIQLSMDVAEFNQLILEFGKEFKKLSPHTSYNVSSKRFVSIEYTREQVIESYKSIKEYIRKVNEANKEKMPPFDVYYFGIDYVPGEKHSNNIKEIVNNLHSKAKMDDNHELVFCNESVLLDMERKRKIYNILKRELNLESESFQVWYQPIYSISKNKFIYMEALSRLNNTELGNVSPGEFVDVAEKTGLIEQLGFVAFQKVCKFIADNRDVVNTVSINFSVYQMMNPAIVKTVLSTIEKFNLKPSNIIMEITESIFIDNYEMVLKNMTDLSNAGVKFYLDDFGTGYSNLANVISLPFSTIKMDRSLVLMMEEDEQKTRFFYNLVSTLKDAGLNILVEGVETQSQNEIVQKAGADYIQGYLYSRPLPPEKCLELLRKQN